MQENRQTVFKRTNITSNDTIRYIDYQDRYYEDMIKLYIDNLLNTPNPRGYDFIRMPIQEHGILRLSSILLLLFGLFYYILQHYLRLDLIVGLYIGLLHIYCFIVCNLLYKKTEVDHCKYIINRFLKRENLKQRFSGDNRIILAVDTEADILVGMIIFETKVFDNVLNLSIQEGGELGRLSVRPEYRGRGIALSLIKMIEDHAKQINKKYIILGGLTSNVRGIQIYKKYGFVMQDVDIPRIFLFKLFGIKIFCMKKDITQ